MRSISPLIVVVALALPPAALADHSPRAQASHHCKKGYKEKRLPNGKHKCVKRH